MINEVEGIAVLERGDTGENLFVLCHYPDGRKNLIIIPVRGIGTEGPANAWTYEIKGDVIYVSPSLKVLSHAPGIEHPKAPPQVERFHNGGSWSVPVKEFWIGKRILYTTPYDLFRALNPEYDPSKV